VQTEAREYLLSFGEESFVLQLVIQKYKVSDIQNYNFAWFFLGGVRHGRSQ